MVTKTPKVPPAYKKHSKRLAMPEFLCSTTQWLCCVSNDISRYPSLTGLSANCPLLNYTHDFKLLGISPEKWGGFPWSTAEIIQSCFRLYLNWACVMKTHGQLSPFGIPRFSSCKPVTTSLWCRWRYNVGDESVGGSPNSLTGIIGFFSTSAESKGRRYERICRCEGQTEDTPRSASPKTD